MIYKVKKSDIFWTIILLVPTVLSYLYDGILPFMYIMLFGGAFSFFILIHYNIYPFKFRLYEFIFPTAWAFLFIVFVRKGFKYIKNKLEQFNNYLDNN